MNWVFLLGKEKWDRKNYFFRFRIKNWHNLAIIEIIIPLERDY